MKAAALQTTNSDTELRQRAHAAGQALADLESARAALADAEREIADLRSRRLARLVEASVDEVRELDEAIARANTRAEITAAKIVPLEAELERLRAAGRDAVLGRNLKEALAIAEEGREEVDRYREHAAAIVAVFRGLAEKQDKLDVLNARLPPGAARVEIEPPRWGGATLASTVVLPGVGEDADYWPPGRKILGLNEIYVNR